MCFSRPPTLPAPEKPQDAKMPEQSAVNADGSVSEARKRMVQTGSAATSTLLTGPSGVENSSLSLGRTTLLGQ